MGRSRNVGWEEADLGRGIWEGGEKRWRVVCGILPTVSADLVVRRRTSPARDAGRSGSRVSPKRQRLSGPKLNKTSALEAVSLFLETIDSQIREGAENLEHLHSALDQLLHSAHFVSFNFDETEHPDPPSIAYSDLRKQIEAAFPSLGFYNTAADVSDNIGETTIAIGDAVDDLTDIVKDLKGIEWRSKHTSSSDALFYFQLGYRAHWGRHARDLSLYIHDLVW